jgi:hypothetical protein
MNTFCAQTFFNAVCFFALSSLCVCMDASAAPRVKPPLEAVRRDDVSSVIGHLEALDVAKGQFEFQVTRVIAGSAALGKANIAASADILSRLAPATDYTLVVLDRRVDPKKPGRVIALDVWQLFDLEGASPPIFLTSETNTALFEAAHVEVERSAGYLSQLLNDLRSADVQLVDLSTAEIIYSDSRIAALTPADSAKLIAVIARTDLRGITRARVLSAASAGNITAESSLLDQLAKQVLLNTPTGQLPWIDSQDELVFAALNHFTRQVGTTSAVKVADLSRWLQSPNPALVEQAALLALRINPNDAVSAMRDALNYALLPRDARSTLRAVLLRSRL